MVSKNISFFLESYLTTSPSKSGAGLPNLGNEFDKIQPHITNLNKMYKVMPKRNRTLTQNGKYTRKITRKILLLKKLLQKHLSL